MDLFGKKGKLALINKLATEVVAIGSYTKNGQIMNSTKMHQNDNTLNVLVYYFY